MINESLTVTFSAQELQDITNVCDAALKAAGLQAMAAVNRINAAIAAAQEQANQAQTDKKTK